MLPTWTCPPVCTPTSLTQRTADRTGFCPARLLLTCLLHETASSQAPGRLLKFSAFGQRTLKRNSRRTPFSCHLYQTSLQLCCLAKWKDAKPMTKIHHQHDSGFLHCHSDPDLCQCAPLLPEQTTMPFVFPPPVPAQTANNSLCRSSNNQTMHQL